MNERVALDCGANMMSPLFAKRELARAARGGIEAALDRVAWRWSRALSLYIDLLLLIEEGDA